MAAGATMVVAGGSISIGAGVNAIEAGQKVIQNIVGGNGSNNISEISLDDLPDDAQDIYNKYDKNGWNGNVSGQSQGTKAGRSYKNDGSEGSQILPEIDANGNPIKYKEFDVNNKIPGQNRDSERFIKGSDGSTYYTDDHYKSFQKVK
ncbi:hypothetical protein IW492_14145 [Enterococcus sp. BWB1-3]|nr:hypothetical protein [Enterococcus sp. BWB1-3]